MKVTALFKFEWPCDWEYPIDSKEFYALILKAEPAKGVILRG
jgi:hypothetical protein